TGRGWIRLGARAERGDCETSRAERASGYLIGGDCAGARGCKRCRRGWGGGGNGSWCRWVATARNTSCPLPPEAAWDRSACHIDCARERRGASLGSECDALADRRRGRAYRLDRETADAGRGAQNVGAGVGQ